MTPSIVKLVSSGICAAPELFMPRDAPSKAFSATSTPTGTTSSPIWTLARSPAAERESVLRILVVALFKDRMFVKDIWEVPGDPGSGIHFDVLCLLWYWEKGRLEERTTPHGAVVTKLGSRPG